MNTRKKNLRSALDDKGLTPKPKNDSTVAKNTTRQPSRVGKKSVVAYVDPSVSQQLRMLAIENSSSNDRLIVEALNDLFVKYGKSPIA